MKAGISTYAYFWRRPSLSEMLEDVARLGGEVFQICDWPELETTTACERHALSRRATELRIELELGTRADSPDEVRRYLSYCADLDSRLLRILPGPSLASVETLEQLLPECESAGVALALETYEVIGSQDLLELVTQLDHPHLGICLDPSNCVAGLEPPSQVMSRLGPHTINLHVKDFVFRRREDRIGFLLVGCPLGKGMLDLDALLDAASDAPTDCNAIIELWLPDLGSGTRELEAAWTGASFGRLRRALTAGRPI